jgi:DnaJ-domain-containing protein 1
MSAPLAGKFQDHYLVLGIEPKADSETIQKAYTQAVARVHPRSGTHPDQEKFDAITLAYEVLSDPALRSTFDSMRASPDKEEAPTFSGLAFFDAMRAEEARRETILSILYDHRRLKAMTPSLSFRILEAMLDATLEELQLTIWYLQKKGWAAMDDKTRLYITVAGIDHLHAHPPNPERVLAMVRTKPAAPASAPPPAPEEPAKNTSPQLAALAARLSRATQASSEARHAVKQDT